uniref:Uncharacterized protein n=1 Tax=Arundo donax TaxID=35708 RepID=A0A0A9H2W4_ARUDO
MVQFPCCQSSPVACPAFCSLLPVSCCRPR